jgi:hypothetical protein
MTIRKVFKSRIPNSSYFFKDGLQAAFLLGRYETDDTSRIKELQAEIDLKHPHIYIDENEVEIDTEAPTPMERIRMEAYEQAKKDLLAAGALDPNKISTSNSGNFALSAANTTTISEGAAASDGASVTQAPTGSATQNTGVQTAGLAKLSAMAAALKSN